MVKCGKPTQTTRITMKFFDINKFKVALHETDNDIVNMRLIINAGAADEGPEEWGTAHFLEHMFFKGTKERDYKEFNKLTSRLGDINAYTSRYRTAYHFTFLADDFKESAKTLLEMVFKPAFPEDELKKEVGVIVEECKMYLDDPSSYFFDNVGQHYIGEETGHPIIGTLESIQNTTLDKIKSFVSRFYRPGNMLVAVCGNISETDLQKVFEEHLPDLEETVNVRKRPTLNLDDFAFHHKSQQAIMSIAMQGFTANEEASMGFLPDILCNALGGGMHSLLFDRLREELGLCYSASAWHNSAQQYGTCQIFTMLDESNIELAKEEIEKILKKVSKEGFSDELIEIAKKNYLFNFGRRCQTSGGINCMADSYFDLADFPLERYIDYDDRRKNIDKINNKDLTRVADAIFGEGAQVKFSKMTQDK